MMATPKSPAWRLLGGIQGLVGHGYGSRYPLLMVNFEGQPLTASVRDGLWMRLCESCPGIPLPQGHETATDDWRHTVEWLLAVWQSVQVGLGLPVYEVGRILALSKTQARCVVPSLGASHRALARVVQNTLGYLGRGLQEEDGAACEVRLEQALQALGTHCAKGSNVPRFVKAAYELGLPLQELPGGIYQYGVGSRARWLDSSFTDVTPTISAKLARSKLWASALLRQAGLPVPSHQLVDDPDHAVKVAQHLGYPVVVKPADLDGGVGVAAGLLNNEEVMQAYADAKKHSRKILVEKHVEGRDFRVTVFKGEVIWAIERVPAGVTGDGRSTVAQLIGVINADHRRGVGKHAPLQRLVMDQEASRLLELQGLQETSIPVEGQFVRLRRAANVASGGTPVAAFEQVHPDNARLAVRAAEALRLDLAGIDLLIPDIAVSWRESGAAICEVNGQPNLGQTTAAHLYAEILKQLVPERGRIPTILVFGASHPDRWLQALSGSLAESGMKVGVMGRGEVRVNGETVHSGAITAYAGGKMLALNRQVDAVVMAIEDDSILHSGLPVDRYDALVLAGSNLHSRDPRAKDNLQRWLAELLLCLLPGCDGAVITSVKQGLNAQGLKAQTSAAWYELDGDEHSAMEQAVQLVQKLGLFQARSLTAETQ